MASSAPLALRALKLAKKTGVVRPKDLEHHGIPRTVLARLVESGELERVGRGLYVLPEAPVTEHHTLAEVGRRVPHGVVCLLSALRFHGLTTQAPFEVWLAVDGKARAPKVDYPPLHIVWMTGKARNEGIEVHRIEGVSVRVYSAPKTVADCFKFRNTVGLDVALEALRDYWGRRDRDADAVWRFAKICRVANLIRPYIEALG